MARLNLRIIFAVLMAVGATACSKSPETSSSSANATQAPASTKPALPPIDLDGPIVSLVMASSIDDKGQPVNPQFTFPSDERQLTVLVEVGKITGSPLNITWSRTSDDGDQKLLDHTVEVKSWDRAFSIGKNPGRLAAGSYKVALTLEGHTSELEFDVVAKSSQSAQEGVPPISGGSGIAPQPAAPARVKDGQRQEQKQPVTDCDVGVIPPGMNRMGFADVDSPTVSVTAFNSCYEIHGDKAWATPIGTLEARIDGRPTVVPASAVDNVNRSHHQVDPCSLDHGSDLPGTKVSFRGIAAENPSKTYELFLTLGDDTLAPRVHTISSVKRGTKVKEGDQITLDVTAQERRSGGPWQTGVKIIQVTADPGGLVGKPWTNPSNLPKPCDQKTWSQPYKATYTVPKNPPEIIRICAIAEDYQGNQSSQCGEFPTGDVWRGTIKVKAVGNVYDEEGELALAFTVAKDGSVKGKAHFHRTASRPHFWYINSCTFTQTYSSDEADLLITGRREGDQFTLNMDPRSAMGTMTSSAKCPDGRGGAGSSPAIVLGPLAAFAVHPIVIEAKDGALNHFLHDTFNDIATDATIKVNRAPEN